MINYQEIAYRLYISRKQRGLTQEDLAVLLGQTYGNSDVSNMEHAKKGSGIYRLDKLELYAKALNIDTEWLIFGNRQNNIMNTKYFEYENRFERLYKIALNSKTIDDFYLKYNQDKLDELSLGDVNKIFNNLSKSVPEKLIFIDPRKDEFNGLEIDTPYYPAHIRKALELAGYGKDFIKDTRKAFPIAPKMMNEDIKYTRDYAGLSIAEYPTKFGYITILIRPMVTTECSEVYIPYDSREGVSVMSQIFITAHEKSGKKVASLTGYVVQLWALYDKEFRQDIFGMCDESSSMMEEFYLMTYTMYPEKLTNTTDMNESLFHKYSEWLWENEDDLIEDNVFLFSEAEVNEEYRNQGIFSTMRRILMDWFYLEGECYCLYADNKELIERNTAIAINKGFVILDKENTLYDIYANEKCPYAYRANPIH